MNYRTRTHYTDAQKALMWERWKEGWTLHQVGHLFDRPHTSIHTILSKTGGIRPPDRRRSAKALTLAEREEISRALVIGESMRSVAARLGRAPSTISREIGRNAGKTAIGRASPTKQPGTVPCGRSAANWSRIGRWLASWRTCFECGGRRSRSAVGSSILIRTTRAFMCHTRPSTAACSFKRVAR